MSPAPKDHEDRLDEHEHKLTLLEQWREHVEKAAHGDRISRLESLAMKVTYTLIGALLLLVLENAGIKAVVREIFK